MKKEDFAGVVFHYKTSDHLLYKDIYPSHITLTREDTKDTGTLVHELAHTMRYPSNQNKLTRGAVDFYKRDPDKEDQKDEKIYTWCEETKANVPNLQNCKNYIGAYSFSAPISITGDPLFEKWGLVDRKVSIMGHSSIRADKNKGWVDRDSYQRALAYLYSKELFLSPYLNPEDTRPLKGITPINRIIPDKAFDEILSFSFFYNPLTKGDDIVEHFKAKKSNLKQERFTAGLKESFKGSIEMKLLDEEGNSLKMNGKEIKAIFPHRMALKLIPEEGSEPIPDILLDLTPISVVFPIPEGLYSKEGGKSLTLLIKAVDEKGNIKEKRIEEKNQEWRQNNNNV